MKTDTPGRFLLLIKHAMPVLNPQIPAKEWQLGDIGRQQSIELAKKIKSLQPFDLYCSPEHKAQQTAEIVANQLEISFRIQFGLEEIDRPVLPIMNSEKHIAVNQRIFLNRDLPALGNESANAAVARFSCAVSRLVSSTGANIAIVAHGTVVSLFVEQYNDIDAFDLWKRLDCCQFIQLSLPEFTWDHQIRP